MFKNVNVYSEMPLPLVDMQVPLILSFVSNYTEGIIDRPSGLWYQYGIIRGPLCGYCSRSSNPYHYGDVIIGAMASQVITIAIIYSTVYSDADQRKRQSSASLAFVLGIHRWPITSPHKCFHSMTSSWSSNFGCNMSGQMQFKLFILKRGSGTLHIHRASIVNRHSMTPIDAAV